MAETWGEQAEHHLRGIAQAETNRANMIQAIGRASVTGRLTPEAVASDLVVIHGHKCPAGVPCPIKNYRGNLEPEPEPEPEPLA